MQRFHPRQPVKDKPHITKRKGTGGKNKVCWRAMVNYKGSILGHNATTPVFAYRGVVRKINSYPFVRRFW